MMSYKNWIKTYKLLYTFYLIIINLNLTSLTLSRIITTNLQLTLRKHPDKNMKHNLFLGKYNFWFELKTVQRKWQKGKLLIMRAISLFATMFSKLINNYTFICKDFSYFCLDVFKVVCCRFILCGKGLIVTIRNRHICSRRLFKPFWQKICS